MKLHTCWIALVLLAACNDPNRPSEPPVITLQPTTQWSGGEVRLTSSGFASTDLPLLVAGAETLAVTRVSDSVVSARLPIGSSGPVPIEWHRRSSTFPAGTVQRVGFREERTTPGVRGVPLIRWAGGAIQVLCGALYGYNGGRVRMVSIDLETMIQTEYPGAYTFDHNGISPTFQPGEYVVLDSSYGGQVVRLGAGTMTVLDSIHTPGSSQVGTRQLSRLSDSVWLRTTNHFSNSFSGLTALPGGWRLEDPSAVVLSPRKDLVAIVVPFAEAGVPVFDASTGSVAYTLGPNIRMSAAAAFSNDGERLFMVAGPAAHADSLLSLRAATGEVLTSTKVAESDAMAMATDPEYPLLYTVSYATPVGHPVFRVYSSENLALVGELPVPATSPVCHSCFDWALGIDRVRHRLYGVTGGEVVYVFDLIP